MMTQTLAGNPNSTEQDALAVEIGGTRLILDFPCPHCGGAGQAENVAHGESAVATIVCKRCNGKKRIPSAEGAALLVFFKRHLREKT